MKSSQNTSSISLWHRLLQAFGPDLWTHRRRLFQSYVLSLVTVVATVLLPWPLKIIIDHGITDHPLPSFLSWLQAWGTGSLLITVMIMGFIIITIIYATAGAGSKILEAKVRERLGLGIRDSLLSRLQDRPPIGEDNERRGDLLLRLMSDVNTFARFQTKTLPLIFRHTATVFLILATMFWIEPLLALGGLSLLPIFGVFIWRYGVHLRNAMKQKRAKENDVAGFAQEIVHGLSTTKGLGHEQQMRQHFGTVNAESLKAGVHATRAAVGMERVLQIAQGVAVALITGGGALLVLRGRLSIGELTIFVSYITQLLKPVEKINELASAFSRGLVSGERLLSLLDRCPSIQDASHAVTLKKVEGVLDLHDVSFRYSTSKEDEGDWILHGVTMRVEPGHLTVLVGESGSGKSTLLYLLARFFDPSSGEIKLDGRPLTHIAVNSLRSQITLMLQDTHLFAGTLRMALTPPDQSEIDDSSLWEALSLVGLDSFIHTLPLGLETQVGENAVNFSGGQRRRVSLARAFLLNRPILLLDEPLANVDEESESAIIQALEHIRIGRTCLVATHTQALIERADDIISLKNGRIVPNRFDPSPMTTLAERS